MKYYVSFNWLDLDGELKYEKKEFPNKQKAEKFYNSIRYTNKLLIKKYGVDGIYHPYFNIELEEK